MSATQTSARLPLAEAEALAGELLALFEGCHSRAGIFGSIRRQQLRVGDIELLFIPRIEPASHDLWDNPVGSVNRVLERIHELIAADQLSSFRDPETNRTCRGERLQRLVFRGFQVDLHMCMPEQWGMKCVYCTGSADWNKRLVTPAPYGWLPPDMRLEDCRVYRYDETKWPMWAHIPTPEEEDVFAAIGRPFVAPQDRYIAKETAHD